MFVIGDAGRKEAYAPQGKIRVRLGFKAGGSRKHKDKGGVKPETECPVSPGKRAGSPVKNHAESIHF
jgi:hypothetical protein